jgi:hypothetical protein
MTLHEISIIRFRLKERHMLRAYWADEKWERLRVVAWPDNHNGRLIERAMLTLTPLKQTSPLLDPNDPRMLDPVMG